MRGVRAWVGWAVVALCAVVAVGRSLAAKSVPPPRRLTPQERKAVGQAAAALEPGWRLKSIHGFPGDCWSQDDDFSASEWSWVREEAARRRVPVTEIFRAIDEELHSHPVQPPRKSNACPCKPRPYYG